MDMHQLEGMGAFVPKAIFQREIPITFRPQTSADSWESPDVPEYEAEYVTRTVTVHIRKRNSADFLKIVRAPDTEKPLLPILLCVVTPEGAPVFPSLDKVAELQDFMLGPLLRAVDEVNDYDAKKSTPRMSGGVTSPSPSAAPLPSVKPASRKKNAASG